MKRWSSCVILTALGGALVPASAAAQRATMQTRSAEVYMNNANQTADSEKRREELQKALDVLMEGAKRDENNALIWLMAGQAYARLGDVAGADSAFDRAETLYPEYAEQIGPERLALWINEYNKGIAAIQAGDVPGAIERFEAADAVYRGRPDAAVTLGSLYTQAGDLAKAEAAYRSALEIARGPASRSVEPDGRAQWDEQEEIAASRLAELQQQLGRSAEAVATYQALVESQPDNPRALSSLAAQLAMAGRNEEAAQLYEKLLMRDDLSDVEWFNAGVGLYTAGNHPLAIEAFEKSRALNPYARDALYNLGQALYGAAAEIEKAREEAPEAEHAAFNARIAPLYEQLAEVAMKLRDIDPHNRNAIMMLAQAQRSLGEMASDAAASTEWREKVLATLQSAEDMPFEVAPVDMQWSEDGVAVSGNVTNLKATPGEPIVLEFTLVGEGGAVVATETVRLVTPAVDERVSFSFAVSTDETVYGWRYKAVG